jgi:hypothetical protein
MAGLVPADRSDQSPIKPPRYLDEHGRHHKHGIAVADTPLCTTCAANPRSHAIIERNSRAAAREPNRNRRKLVVHISVTRPLDHNRKLKPQNGKPSTDQVPKKYKPPPVQDARRPPKWMELLPSNVNPHVRPPRHSILQRRLSFPYIEHTRYSTPFMTPLEYPEGSQKVESAVVAELSRSSTAVYVRHREEHHKPESMLPERVSCSAPGDPYEPRKLEAVVADELSKFFASREGKYLLPSRVLQLT